MSTTTWTSALTLPVSASRDHIRGSVSAPVTLVEYGDYECPFCALAHRVVGELRSRLGEQVCFVFRHFPLTTMHPHAQAAAEAAEAAAGQRKFWDMHDTLYRNQKHLDDSHLLAYANDLGLDLRRFRDDLESHAHFPKVREDFMSGVRSGVNGTPTFYINGARHDGSWDLPSLLAATQSAMSAPRKLTIPVL
jgi:protein-disulfide isomerase